MSIIGGQWKKQLPFGRGMVVTGIGEYQDGMRTQIFNYIESGEISPTFEAVRPFLEYLQYQQKYDRLEVGKLSRQLFSMMIELSEE